MSKIQIPGAFWVALVAGVVPVLQGVLVQYFPEAEFWWSAVIVTLLGAAVKAVQVANSKPVVVEQAPEGVAAAPMVAGQPGKVKSFLFG